MWTTTENLEVQATPRPTRLAYLVPEAPPHELLDDVFRECFGRWGGRRTPIIKTNGATIDAGDWALLDYWDADIIYSFVPLSDELEDTIFRTFAPSEIKTHRTATKPNTTDFRPDYSGNFHLVQSLSLLPLFTRRAEAQGNLRPFIADFGAAVQMDRDAQDSFGLLSESFVGESALPYADIATVGEPTRQTSRGNAPSRSMSFGNINELFAAMAVRRDILALSRLSDMFCPYLAPLESGRNGWSDHLTIVVGDSVDDRLLYWGAQHRYPSSEAHPEQHVLRVSEDRMLGEQLDWLKRWLTLHGHHLNGNHAPRAIFKSTSVSEEQMQKTIQGLDLSKMTMISVEYHEAASLCAADEFSKYQSARPSANDPRFFIWHGAKQKSSSVIKYDQDRFDVPLAKPWHIANFDHSPRNWGTWAVDLTISRAENHSIYGNIHHHWWFPRRLRMDGPHIMRYGSPNMVLPPVCRPTSLGDLTVWDDAGWRRTSIHVPRDLPAFMNAIANYPLMAPKVRRANWSDESKRRYQPVRISDKGRDLLGTFQFFKSLPEALSYLTDPYWTGVFDNLAFASPADKKKNVKDIASQLRVLLEDEQSDDEDFERLANRTLGLVQRGYEAQSERLKSYNFEQLYQLFQKDQGNDKGNERRSLLEDSITYLRDVEFFWQGFKWTCTYCQHQNWVDLEDLTPVAECEICRHAQSSRVSGSLDFRLNPFAHHAFSSSSAQGPVIWCIAQLLMRCWHSFGVAPALDLYDPKSEKRIGDIDVSANVDGKIYLAEVKSSFAGVTDAVLAQMETLALELRPDVVMLAVHSELEVGSEVDKMLKQFASKFSDLDIQFELLHLGNARETFLGGEIALPIANEMTWSA